MFRIVYLLCFLVLYQLCYSQKIEINNLKLNNDEQISFSCLIKDHHSERETYDLIVYASTDDYKNSLKINEKTHDLLVNHMYHFSFNAKEQLSGFYGDLKLKLIVNASLFPIQIDNSFLQNKIKKGESLTIKWKDHLPNQKYSIELLRDDIEVKSLAINRSKKEYTWNINKEVKSGKGYQLRVIPSGDLNRGELSEGFTIRKKIPTGLVVAPVLGLIGAGIYILTLSENPTDPVVDDMPDPPIKPTN